jgi:hypothetical protein
MYKLRRSQRLIHKERINYNDDIKYNKIDKPRRSQRLIHKPRINYNDDIENNETKYDMLVKYNPADTLKEVKSFLINDINMSYLYVIRIYIRKSCNLNENDEKDIFYCYKVGFASNIKKRLKELNHQFDSCAGVDNTNIILCFLIKIDNNIELREKETLIKNKLEEYNIKSFNGIKKFKECFQINIKSYTIIEKFCQSFNDDKYWISDKYAINDDETNKDNFENEFFEDNYLGSVYEDKEYI